ncbi:MAG: hypothetical protein Q8P64_01370 [Deltaproteobacteria bacterium]|nr:hypothetical protein [Deltaproteobacteria bacterium]
MVIEPSAIYKKWGGGKRWKHLQFRDGRMDSRGAGGPAYRPPAYRQAGGPDRGRGRQARLRNL